MSENVLAIAYAARLRSDEYAAELETLRKEFEDRDDVIALKRRIDRCEEERRQAIKQAKDAGITKDGNYLLRIRTRKTRTVIPEKFFAKYGAETFVACSTVAIGKAETAVGKNQFDDCCNIEVKETGVSVEYMSPRHAEVPE